jgi:hypothetical protein
LLTTGNDRHKNEQHRFTHELSNDRTCCPETLQRRFLALLLNVPLRNGEIDAGN